MAIDVVLLPSEEMTEEAISLNRSLSKESGTGIHLNKKDCLPHLSLWMGCIEEKDILAAEHILKGIAQQHPALELIAQRINTATLSTGKNLSGITVKNTRELQRLHKDVLERLRDILSYDVDAGMLFNPADIDETTLTWIRNYATLKQNPSQFHPHITVGFGEPAKGISLHSFSASTLALCHLGNDCTCKNILFSIALGKEI